MLVSEMFVVDDIADDAVGSIADLTKLGTSPSSGRRPRGSDNLFNTLSHSLEPLGAVDVDVVDDVDITLFGEKTPTRLAPLP